MGIGLPPSHQCCDGEFERIDRAVTRRCRRAGGIRQAALIDALCKRLRERFGIAVITNDIYTEEDAQFLVRSGAPPPERIVGVETGGCSHTAIREDASINLAAVEQLIGRFPDLEIVFIESGGDNLAATFAGAGRPYALRHRRRRRR